VAVYSAIPGPRSDGRSSLRTFHRQSPGHVLGRRGGERVGHGAIGEEAEVPEALQLEHRRGEVARVVAPQVQSAGLGPLLEIGVFPQNKKEIGRQYDRIKTISVDNDSAYGVS